MLFLNSWDHEISFIIPYKSGHSLIFSTLIEVLKLNKITYSLEVDTRRLQKNCFLFVRNPIDRFFSGYHWVNKLKLAYEQGESLDKEKEKHFKESYELFKNLEIYSLNDYIVKYKSFINCVDDMHYLPQTSFFLTKTTDNGVRANLNFNFRKEYDRYFDDINYRIFRIEEINETIEVNNKFLESTDFNFANSDTLGSKGLKKFPFLKSFSEEINQQFMVYYTYFMGYYNLSHHLNKKNLYGEVSVVEFLNLLEMFRKEILFFGYNDEIDSYKKNLENISQ